jgi:hypothetical protein
VINDLQLQINIRQADGDLIRIDAREDQAQVPESPCRKG